MAKPKQAEPTTVDPADPTTQALAVEQVAVDLIDPNPWNPNVQTEVIARATRESLQRFGFVEPVLLRPHGKGRFEIVNGEHRWIEAQALGYVSVPAVVRELSDNDAKKLTIVLNETQGDPDVVLLGQLLNDLSSLDDFATALPYTDAELQHLLAIGADDWDNFQRGQADADDDDDEDSPPAHDHEVVLGFTDDQHTRFREWTEMIERELSIDGGVSAVVYEAVRRVALDVNQADEFRANRP